MAKVNKQPEYRYTTDQVDLMLWQYCEGLFDLVPYLPRDKAVKIFKQNADGKVAKIKAVFQIDPSFNVELVITPGLGDSVRFDMVKTKLP